MSNELEQVKALDNNIAYEHNNMRRDDFGYYYEQRRLANELREAKKQELEDDAYFWGGVFVLVIGLPIVGVLLYGLFKGMIYLFTEGDVWERLFFGWIAIITLTLVVFGVKMSKVDSL